VRSSTERLVEDTISGRSSKGRKEGFVDLRIPRIRIYRFPLRGRGSKFREQTAAHGRRTRGHAFKDSKFGVRLGSEPPGDRGGGRGTPDARFRGVLRALRDDRAPLPENDRARPPGKPEGDHHPPNEKGGLLKQTAFVGDEQSETSEEEPKSTTATEPAPDQI
jgi:hypothetical protein